MEKMFGDNVVKNIYLESGVCLWSESYKEQTLSLNLKFCKSEIREGLLTLGLKLDNKSIYHINFWITSNANRNSILNIGTLQGSRNGLAINKELTKHFFGYRPKNLVVYALRIIAQSLSIDKIYAVSDYGFYANNHIPWNRKIQPNLNKFWKEIEGIHSEDQRFFSIPLIETRKSIEEVASHKRNLYRKRFAVLDKIAEDILTTLDLSLKVKIKKQTETIC